jgi:hypothetical protein
MKKRVTNDIKSRKFESKLDPAFRSTGNADYSDNTRRRKTGAIGSKRVIRKAITKYE